MGAWLFDSAFVQTAYLAEAESIVTTERYREHSEWGGRFPVSAYDALSAARYAMVDGCLEVFQVEKPTLTKARRNMVDVEGQSATALLSLRTIVGTKNWNAITAGSMISDMMSDFTSSRGLLITFGTGTTVGSTFTLQRSWGDCGEIALEVLAAQNLGMKAVLTAGALKLVVYGPTDATASVWLGEKFRDGSTARLITDKKAWRNYAYVLGEGTGASRVQVIVDQTSGAERRELYVDASDLTQGALTLAQYQAALSARGAAKLADTRLVEYAEASDVTADVECGDVIYYDADVFGDTFMVTEVTTTREGGTVKRAVALGDPPADLRKTFRRLR